MSNIFLSSDSHFGHTNVIKYCNRPFSSTEEMNETMVERWNEVVSKEDLIYYLGDFSLRFKYVKKYLPRLNGKKILIYGNHDSCWKKSPESKWYKAYLEEGFLELHKQLTIEYQNYRIKLSHMPYADDPSERYHSHRPSREDEDFLFCGHVHEKWKIKENQINVGVDVWDFFPVSIDQLLKELTL